MLRKILLPVTLVLSLTALATIPGFVTAQSSSSGTIQASNYCQACHTTGDPRLQDATAWVGGIDHNQINPCPAASRINEEIYYTERLLLAIERARHQVPSRINLEKSDARLVAASQSYSRLLDSPVTSLEAFTSEAEMIRYQLGKVYSAVSQTAIENAKRARVFWVAIGASLVAASSLVWGWINAHNALRTPHAVSKNRFGFYFSRAVFLGLVFVLFALPIFRLPSQAVTVTSAEEQERQLVLDETARAALTGDRELSRAWMLAQISAVWAQKDLDRGTAILDEALAAAQEAQYNTSALWGLSQNAKEAGGAEYAKKGEAALVAADLDAARGRIWGLRLIAEAWMGVDQTQAEAILENALEQLDTAVYPYAQLDLRAIAVTWAQLDPEKGLAVARRITDPAMRSWAIREIAAISGDADLFDMSAEAARQVSDPLNQARLLGEVGAAAGLPALFDEAAGLLEDVKGAAGAFALADLVSVAGNASWVAQISSKYPAAQALAYFNLGEYENAWKSAENISDPFEQARAQASIAGAWGSSQAASQIAIPLLRDRALRDISQKTGQTTLVEKMEDSYYQVQVLTASGEYEQAWQIAKDLGDGYPLVALGTAWVESDLQAASQVLDALSREADKAILWRAIAAVTGKQDHFESALGMALAARVRGDALSPVQASLDLADLFNGDPQKYEAALNQAYEATQKINIIY